MKNLNKIEMTVLDLEEVKKETGLDDTFINQLVFQGDFPQPILICGQVIGWSEREIREWMWIKAIETSWGSDSRWKGEAYSNLRHPSNVLGVKNDFFDQIQADVKMNFQPEEGVIVPISVNHVDPFSEVLEMDAAKK